MSTPLPSRRFPVLLLAAAFVPLLLVSSAHAAATRPNIIVLLTDDQRWDTLGAMGNPIIQTPHLDRLAREGVMFRNAYVTTAICSISRASILSGQFAARHGILDFATPFTPEALAETYPVLLKRAGYRTGFLGKYGVGGRGPLPEEHFDYWWAMAHQPRYENKQPDGTIKHYTDLLTEHATKFLEDSDREQPFCLSISYKAPHVQDGDPRQFIYNPRYENLYADVTIPPADRGSDEFFHKLPPVLATEQNEGRVRWHLRFDEPEKYQRMMKGYYRLITGVDDAVAQLRKDLEARGLAENTVIVFLGDHGFYLGEHGLAGKWYGHEESIRIPLLVHDGRAKGIKGGQVREEMVLNIDVAPTVLELAGLKVPTGMQGRSLLPLLNGRSPRWRRDFFYEHNFKHAAIPRSEGVVSADWKYLRYVDTDPLQEELYDLRNDRGEVNNLAADAGAARQLAKLRKRFEELKREAR
ncbi:MAG TPA: sulfatase [Verrucomicrobiales bacterium]|nr:sulfatase [Verrucomicrobiales bacterium]